MSHVPWSVCLCLCVGHGCAVRKGLNRSRCRLGLTLVGQRNHVLHGGQGWMNPFAAMRGDMSAMWPFVKLLWTLVFILLAAFLHTSVRQQIFTTCQLKNPWSDCVMGYSVINIWRVVAGRESGIANLQWWGWLKQRHWRPK